jgi:ElaB/YqjD/DUF883 family membrane-anchored ribosome-binding protein
MTGYGRRTYEEVCMSYTSENPTDRTQSGQNRDTLAAAQDDASAVMRDASAKAQDAAADIRDKADDVLGTVQDKGAEVADAVKAKAEDLASQGKDAGAEKAEGLAGAVRRVADDLESTSPEIARHVRTAADSLEGIAGSLRERSVGSLVEEVSGFARRQPAAFFGTAVLAGFAISRFAKSSAPGTATASSTGTPSGLAGQAPGWAPAASGKDAHPMTMSAASLGGAAAHRPGTAGPGSMPTIDEVSG